MILHKVECIFRHCYDESTYFNIKRTADVNVRGFKYGNFGFLFPKKNVQGVDFNSWTKRCNNYTCKNL